MKKKSFMTSDVPTMSYDDELIIVMRHVTNEHIEIKHNISKQRIIEL